MPEGQVLQQLRKGYKLRDRLVRPATVVVAKKPVSPAPPETSAPDATAQ
ncbi:MAG: nucleotide exchange factor GrpE [Verrucomicrobia bacterium]|nr:nucleotide exchange factor GrpE [Verrucomicrobiota bacterium]